MESPRAATLLAPVTLMGALSRTAFLDAEPWGHRAYAMRPLLGETFSFAIATQQLTEAGIPNALPAGIEMADDGHRCVVFKAGVAIIRVQLVLHDSRQLLRRWPEPLEQRLPELILSLANKILPNSVDTSRGHVDWTYPIVDTDDYIDVRYPNDEAQREALANSWKPPEPIDLGNKSGTRIWVEWSAAQVARLQQPGDPELQTERIIDVFVVRSACWQLLTACGLRAVQALTPSERPTTSDASKLRNLQVFGSNLVISYHTSLWTNDQYLVRIFDAIDDAWNAARELTKTRDVLERVAAVLATQRGEELERRNQQLEKRDRILGATALALAALTLVSAVADSFTILEKLGIHEPRASPFGVPVAVLIVSLGIVLLVSRRKDQA